MWNPVRNELAGRASSYKNYLFCIKVLITFLFFLISCFLIEFRSWNTKKMNGLLRCCHIFNTEQWEFTFVLKHTSECGSTNDIAFYSCLLKLLIGPRLSRSMRTVTKSVIRKQEENDREKNLSWQKNMRRSNDRRAEVCMKQELTSLCRKQLFKQLFIWVEKLLELISKNLI